MLSKNSQTKGHILYDPIYTEYSESTETEKQAGIATGPGQWGI